MLERFVTLTCGLDEEHETLDRFRLPAELLEHRRTQRDIKRGIGCLGVDGKIFGVHKN
jgi:Trp operon repressor